MLSHRPHSKISSFLFSLCALFLISTTPGMGQGFEGYYQYPTLSDHDIIFTAEGDLWKVAEAGGLAQRLTTHPGEEQYPKVSPDGKTIAFGGNYEGIYEVYTMPVDGGLPVRWTYEASYSRPSSWTPNGDLVYTTRHYATLPDLQLININLTSKVKSRVPLSEASEAAYNEAGNTLFFVRPAYHNNVTKRYKGGTARQIWKFKEGTDEAIKISDAYAGGCHHPMWWNERVYFITDRDGIMNIWSITEDGQDYQQHTQHDTFDVRYASLRKGKIVYQTGADIWLLNLSNNEDQKVKITLATDLDQRREKWVMEPEKEITSYNVHPEGESITLTARGRVFVAPVDEGRVVQMSRKEGVRYRDATYAADGDHVIVLSDESKEFEFYTYPATGIGSSKQLTQNGEILRYQGVPSPDGKWIAYDDLNNDMWLFNINTQKHRKISSNQQGIGQISWSPNSKWVTFGQSSVNTMYQIMLFSIDNGSLTPLTTDRANSFNHVWSPDGQWIYFLSDRNFQSLVGSPWGPRQPEPYFDKKMKIYHIPIQANLVSPFSPNTELSIKKEDTPAATQVDLKGIAERIQEVAVEPGNYSSLAVNDKALYFLSSGTGIGSKKSLMGLKIENEGDKAVELHEGTSSFKLSADGKHLVWRKGNKFYVSEAGTSKFSDVEDDQVDLSDWSFSIDPLEDWRQLFTDAWRMERDYFYDPGMHGVDWDAMYQRYYPLVDRVTTRIELSDLIGRFVGELSALHTSVRGGDVREGPDDISIPSLGARFSRNEQKGGYVIDHIYRADPDYPDQLSPLDAPPLNINNGDVLMHINGVATLSITDVGELLRNQTDKQVRIGVKSAATNKTNDYVVVPKGNEYSLRYSDWEYSRRLAVEAKSEDIGYVHLRAMGSRDISQWYREFYPVFNRKGLIIDVRGNRGGNIESFILEKLLRKAWFYWKERVGVPSRNMQYAFTGHMVVLVDAKTASDGEAFAEGFKRLGMGKVIGTRTWGGEIWLSSSNRLSDGGLARAPMMGVYGLESEWLIEGHGVDPDIVIDNLPHATFKGQDAQLDKAIEFLLEEISKDPRDIPTPPAYPDLSFPKEDK